GSRDSPSSNESKFGRVPQTGQASSTGLAEAAEVSAAGPAYGLPDPAANGNSTEHSRVASSVLPLLILVVGLAVATVWFVALPALDKPPAKASCEVVVLKSGSPA